MKSKIQKTKNFLESKGIKKPQIGIILGTGLGQFINHINKEIELDYEDIPHFPKSTVEFHSGKLIYGNFADKKLLIMQGRFHIYEGYSLTEVTYPIRVFKELGIKYLFISNSAGAINTNYKKGELLLIDDHINLQGGSPLAKKNIEDFGPRFVDMIYPYSKKLNNLLKEIAIKNNINLNEGVYAAVVGPQLETRAEYRYLKTIGADAVGMSTVPEVIVANQISLPCAAICVLTDECDPDNLKPINIKEILELASKTEPKIIKILKELLYKL